ncbi:hypothetical protein [Paractinoplanes durhamensis]|uniref:hypothetical protein n=1 Tax=Paractinoplanes durhamensis TaxID=113563 RepID=UPI0036269D21
MQEADVQEALKAYVTDGEPAMGLTADGVLKAGRRSRRARRLAGVAGAGLAAVLAGVAAVGVWGGSPDGPEYMAADPCPVPPGARPAGVIAGDQPLSPNLVAWATTSVTCYLNAEVPRLLPTATYAQVPGAQAGPLMGFNLGGQPPWGNRVDALALIRDAKGVGDLTVNVGVVDESVAAQAEAECRGDTVAKCTVMSGPKGSTVLLGTEPDGTPAGEPKTGWSGSTAGTARSTCRSRTPIGRRRTVRLRSLLDRSRSSPLIRPCSWRSPRALSVPVDQARSSMISWAARWPVSTAPFM